MTPLRIVLLTGGSPLFLPILTRLTEMSHLQVVGILYDTESTQPRRSLLSTCRRLLRNYGVGQALLYVLLRLTGIRRGVWRSGGQSPFSLDRLQEAAAALQTVVHRVDDINAPDTVAWLQARDAELGVVVGTRILKPEVFTALPRGMINVHQGKIPYYRGGACLFWALLNGEAELGVTIHEVVRDVDAGAVICQDTIPLTYDIERYHGDFDSWIRDTLPQLDELGVTLMVRALDEIARGVDTRTPVDLALGKRYRRPTARDRRTLRRLLRQRGRGGAQS